MTRATICILEEIPEEGLNGPVELGRTEDGEILVDCPRKAERCPCDCRIYRKDSTQGGQHVHRAERASGMRKAAIREHRFLGESGT